MAKNNHSSSRTISSGCHSRKDIQTVQSFPRNGLLADNLGLPLQVLRSQVSNTKERSCSYIVSSVKLHHKTITFEQHGSAPNFQGDRLTLCTCKHQMRASQSAEKWQSTWVAGFTSRTIHNGKHWLFYLAKIDTAYESHAELWKSMRASSRNAKAAHTHFLGDLFKPKTPLPTGKSRFTPSRYVKPTIHAHRQHQSDKGWQNDINYKHASRYRHPPLLVSDPQHTYLWDEPTIYYAQNHCRNYLKWSSLQELIAQLRKV